MNRLGNHNTLFRSPAQSGTPLRSPRSASLSFWSPPSRFASAEEEEDFILHAPPHRRHSGRTPPPSPDIHPSHFHLPHLMRRQPPSTAASARTQSSSPPPPTNVPLLSSVLQRSAASNATRAKPPARSSTPAASTATSATNPVANNLVQGSNLTVNEWRTTSDTLTPPVWPSLVLPPPPDTPKAVPQSTDPHPLSPCTCLLPPLLPSSYCYSVLSVVSEASVSDGGAESSTCFAADKILISMRL